MNRPRATDFALGARATVWGSSVFAGLTTLSWFGPHGVAWYVALPALLFCRASFAAKRRITAWRAWRGAWDELAQPPPPARPAAEAAQAKPTQEAPAKRTPRRMPRAVFVVAWLVLFAWLRSHQGESSTPALGIGALCFFALAFWGLLIAARGAGRWLRTPVRPRTKKVASSSSPAPERDNAVDADGNVIVAHCLPVPTHAPARHVRELLPDYARALLAYTPGKDAR